MKRFIDGLRQRLSSAIFSLLVAGHCVYGYEPIKQVLDLDGDGLHELVLHDASLQAWRAYKANGTVILDGFEFGAMGALPVAGKFLEGGKATLGYYRPLSGQWILLDGSLKHVDPAVEPSIITVNVMRQGIPLVGNFTGDDRDELALFNPFDNTWSIWNAAGAVVLEHLLFGTDGLQFAAADVTGDGVAELISYDQQAGRWQLLSVHEAQAVRELAWPHNFGVLITRDFNADGIDDLGIWTHEGKLKVMDPKTGEMILNNQDFGDSYSLPVHGSYEDTGTLNLAYFSMARGVWHLRRLDGTITSPNFPRHYE